MSEGIIIALITAIGSLLGGVIGQIITASATVKAAAIKEKVNSPTSNKEEQPRSWGRVIGGALIGAVATLIILSLLGIFPLNQELIVYFLVLSAVISFFGILLNKNKELATKFSNTFKRSASSTNEIPSKISKSSKSSILSSSTYHRFIGRSTEIEKVMSALRDPKNKPIIAIEGFGGLGKTTLAIEAKIKCNEENLFNNIVEVTYKTDYLIGESIKSIEISDYTFNKLLSDICQQCGRTGIVDAPLEKKIEVVRELLSDKHILIILDNLETIRDKDELVDSVFQIIGKSKLLITSREIIKHNNVFHIELGGLSKDEGVIFLQETRKHCGLKQILNANRATLVEIWDVTGGAPLAMQLVIGQMDDSKPISKVLKDLKEPSFKSRDYEFYQFLYNKSWSGLTFNAKHLLVAMRHVGELPEQFMKSLIKTLNEDDFYNAITLLKQKFLIDVIESSKSRLYSLHPLTRYFIDSDIASKWQ